MSSSSSGQHLKLKVRLESLTVLFYNAPLVGALPRVFLVLSHGGHSIDSKSVSLVQSHQSPGTYSASWSNAVVPISVDAERVGRVFVFTPNEVVFELKGRSLGKPEPKMLAKHTFQFSSLKQENLSASEAIERRSLDMTVAWVGALSESRAITLQAMFEYRLKDPSPQIFKRLWAPPKRSNRFKAQPIKLSQTTSSSFPVSIPRSQPPQEENKLSLVYIESVEYDGSIMLSCAMDAEVGEGVQADSDSLTGMLVDYSCSPPKVPPRSPILKPKPSPEPTPPPEKEPGTPPLEYPSPPPDKALSPPLERESSPPLEKEPSPPLPPHESAPLDFPPMRERNPPSMRSTATLPSLRDARSVPRPLIQREYSTPELPGMPQEPSPYLEPIRSPTSSNEFTIQLIADEGVESQPEGEESQLEGVESQFEEAESHPERAESQSEEVESQPEGAESDGDSPDGQGVSWPKIDLALFADTQPSAAERNAGSGVASRNSRQGSKKNAPAEKGAADSLLRLTAAKLRGFEKKTQAEASPKLSRARAAHTDKSPHLPRAKSPLEKSPKFPRAKPNQPESPEFARVIPRNIEAKPPLEKSPKFPRAKPSQPESPEFARVTPRNVEAKTPLEKSPEFPRAKPRDPEFPKAISRELEAKTQLETSPEFPRTKPRVTEAKPQPEKSPRAKPRGLQVDRDVPRNPALSPDTSTPSAERPTPLPRSHPPVVNPQDSPKLPTVSRPPIDADTTEDLFHKVIVSPQTPHFDERVSPTDPAESDRSSLSVAEREASQPLTNGLSPHDNGIPEEEEEEDLPIGVPEPTTNGMLEPTEPPEAQVKVSISGGNAFFSRQDAFVRDGSGEKEVGVAQPGDGQISHSDSTSEGERDVEPSIAQATLIRPDLSRAISEIEPSTHHDKKVKTRFALKTQSAASASTLHRTSNGTMALREQTPDSEQMISPSEIGRVRGLDPAVRSPQREQQFIKTKGGAEFFSMHQIPVNDIERMRATWHNRPSASNGAVSGNELTTAMKQDATRKRPLKDFLYKNSSVSEQTVGILKLHVAAMSTGDRSSTRQVELADLFGLAQPPDSASPPTEGAYCVFTIDDGNARIETSVKPIVPRRPIAWDKKEELRFYATPSKKVFIMCCKTKLTSESELSTMKLISDISQKKKPRDDSCFGAVILPVSEMKQQQLAFPAGSSVVDVAQSVQDMASEGKSFGLNPRGSVLLQSSFLEVGPRFCLSCFGNMTIDCLEGVQCSLIDDLCCTVLLDTKILRCSSPRGLDECGSDGWKEEPFKFVAEASTDCNVQIWAYSPDETEYWCGGCTVPLAMVLPEEAVLERNATTNNIAYVVMDGCRRTITVPVEPMGTITMTFELMPNPEAVQYLRAIDEEEEWEGQGEEEEVEVRDRFSTASTVSRPPSIACNDVGVGSPERSSLSRSVLMRSFRKRAVTHRAVGGVDLLVRRSYQEHSFAPEQEEEENSDLMREVEYLKEQLRKTKVMLGESEFHKERAEMELRASRDELGEMKGTLMLAKSAKEKTKKSKKRSPF